MPPKVSLTLPKDTKVPDHLAIIPDGNRRWARSRGLHTLRGHKAGFDNAIQLARAAREMGIHTVTLWGFSTENWDRTEEEVTYLMRLYVRLLKQYLKDAKKENVRIIHIGRKDRLPAFLLRQIEYAQRETEKNTKYIGNIALDYGGQDEIVRAMKKMVKHGVTEDKVTVDEISKYMDTYGQPYPNVDLMIRTSGEQRTSGFLLWESAYTEYYWEYAHFPDFGPEQLKLAVLDYSRRRRRFGGNDAVEHLKFDPEVTAKLELAWWRLKKIPYGTGFGEYAMKHLSEQFGLSKELAKEASILMARAVMHGEAQKWEKAKEPLKKFYELLKEELKLAFEPSLAASLELKLWQDTRGKETIQEALDVEDTAKEFYAEVYRISLFQAAKLAHLRVLANIEQNLAERGMGEQHWERAEEYLEKFYRALKERVA